MEKRLYLTFDSEREYSSKDQILGYVHLNTQLKYKIETVKLSFFGVETLHDVSNTFYQSDTSLDSENLNSFRVQLPDQLPPSISTGTFQIQYFLTCSVTYTDTPLILSDFVPISIRGSMYTQDLSPFIVQEALSYFAWRITTLFSEKIQIKIEVEKSCISIDRDVLLSYTITNETNRVISDGKFEIVEINPDGEVTFFKRIISKSLIGGVSIHVTNANETLPCREIVGGKVGSLFTITHMLIFSCKVDQEVVKIQKLITLIKEPRTMGSNEKIDVGLGSPGFYPPMERKMDIPVKRELTPQTSTFYSPLERNVETKNVILESPSFFSPVVRKTERPVDPVEEGTPNIYFDDLLYGNKRRKFDFEDLE
jgi:hypothetical protein